MRTLRKTKTDQSCFKICCTKIIQSLYQENKYISTQHHDLFVSGRTWAFVDFSRKACCFSLSPHLACAGFFFLTIVNILYFCIVLLTQRPIWTVHCEKSLFVLASRQKILGLRTENPAVDARTICLLPIEFFKIPHARTKDTAGKSWPSGLWRDTFYIPLPEKLSPENPGK